MFISRLKFTLKQMPERNECPPQEFFKLRTPHPGVMIKWYTVIERFMKVTAQLSNNTFMPSNQYNLMLVPETPVIEIG
jgi:hypothetical protein